MGDSIFRKKSMDRISSPEQFDEYVRVSSPGMWMLLCAILILLAGALVWGVFGRLETYETVAIVSDGNNTSVYISDEAVGAVRDGMEIRTDYGTCRIMGVDRTPVYIAEGEQPDVVHALDMESDAWVCSAGTDTVLPAGTYSGELVIDSVSPISFVTN